MVEEVKLLALRLRGPAGIEDNVIDADVEDVKACQRRWQNDQSISNPTRGDLTWITNTRP